MTDAAKVAERPGALAVAILWTGENTGFITIGTDEAEALAAFTRAHPVARTDRLECMRAEAQPGGGWAAAIDP